MTHRILITEFIAEAALERLASCVVRYEPALYSERDALLAAARDVDALIVRNQTRVDQAMIDAAPKLRAVGRLGVGLDNIDLDACAARNIAVLPASGANAVSVAEYVIGTAMVLLRGAFFATGAVAAGEWPRAKLSGGAEIFGRTLGLVGFGTIAEAVAVRAQALGMAVSAYDPHRPADDPAWSGVTRETDLGALLASADVISLHVPLTAETRKLIDEAALAGMKPAAVLINTARGGIIDEAALAEALTAGRLAGAALDVFATEPLKAEAGQTFAGVPNLILTPHVAGVTAESNVRVSVITAENVLRALG
ncbi:MAG: hydroxyacid dehydrogenase [Pseudomonadota bacterium]